MHKRYLHHIWVRLRPFKSIYFLAISLLFMGIFVYTYRQADLTMVRLREAVLMADKEDNDVEEPLRALREHVYGHMGADMTKGDNAVRPPVQLKYRYDRLVAAEKKNSGKTPQQIQDEATRLCEARHPAGQLDARVACVTAYIEDNQPDDEKTIPKELYQFDFEAPLWSPDVTGWSLILSIVFLVLFIVRFGLERWMSDRLRHHA